MTGSPCPCCGTAMTVKKDKRGHPWLSCNTCRVVTLIHGKEGVAKFKARTGWQEETTPAAAPPATPAAATGGTAEPKEKAAPAAAPAVGHAARRAARRAGA